MSGKYDPHAPGRAIREKHRATLADLRALLPKKLSPQVVDLLDGIDAALAQDAVQSDVTGYLLESTVTAARMRRQIAEAAPKAA